MTGGASGIGLATARMLARRGARVVCLDLNEKVEEPLIGVRADVSDDDSELAALAARQPTGRLVTAEEVAAAICYLAGPDSGATTGTDLAVDGGMSGLRLRPKPGNEERS